MSSSTTRLKAALSPDESLVAVVVPSSGGRIQIYQTESGLLQTTLTAKAQAFDRVLFCGNNHVVAWTTQGVLVWDLVRGGVVAHSLECLCLDAACHEGTLFLLVGSASKGSDNQKLVVQVHDPTSGRLLRKIKSGVKSDAGSSGIALATSNGKLELLIRFSNGFKMLDAASGKKIAKHKLKDNLKGGSGILVCENWVVIPRLQGTTLYNLKTNQQSHVAASSSQQPQVHLWKDEKDNVLLLADQTLYTCSSGGSPQVTRKLKSQHAMALLPRSNNQLTAILYNQSSFQIQSVDCDGKEAGLVLQWRTPETSKKTTTARASKRSAESLTVLGPGQAGNESKAVSEHRKKPKVQPTTEEEEGISIADRLKKLSQVLDHKEDRVKDDDDKERPNTKFTPAQATTESLSHLLGQALQGGDDGLLELALGVHKRPVIEKTIQGLDPAQVDQLVTKLILKLSRKPTRVQELSRWMSILLQSGKIRKAGQLRPLKSLIQDRLAAFPYLLQLEGRLAVIKSKSRKVP